MLGRAVANEDHAERGLSLPCPSNDSGTFSFVSFRFIFFLWTAALSRRFLFYLRRSPTRRPRAVHNGRSHSALLLTPPCPTSSSPCIPRHRRPANLLWAPVPRNHTY